MDKFTWTPQAEQFLRDHYTTHGMSWCIEKLGLRRYQVRAKAARLGLKHDRSSPFYKEWKSKIGKSNKGKVRVTENKDRYGAKVEVKRFQLRPLVVVPHPMQHRIDEFRSIKSLVTGGSLEKDKYEQITHDLGINSTPTQGL